MSRGALSVCIGTLGLVTCLTACGGSGSSAGSLGRDSSGDPYITDAQGGAIQTGMSADAAFSALGGKASSGSNGQQAVPPLGYDYPVKGTGNPDDPMDDSTTWWQICIGNGQVVSTARGAMGDLPAVCPDS